MFDGVDLTPIWAAIMAFAVMAYVVMDGFDLGCGILFAIERGEEDRDVMVNSIAPVWDGNETWLVLGGGGLFAVFPLAYAIIMPAMYPLITAMMLALIFRGVAFEFRFKAHTRRVRRLWDFAFFGGSVTAALSQGMILGALLQGVKVTGRSYSGGWFDWLTPFTLVCGAATLVGYALLGATWLVWRTEGPLHARVRKQASVLGGLTLGMIAIVSLWSPFLNPLFLQRWFGWPGIVLTSPVPVLMLVLAVLFWRGLARGAHLSPFLCVLGWFGLCFAGLGISMFPLMVPPDVTIYDAAAPHASQAFLLVGASVLIPVILVYTGFSYWVFRGKVKAGIHYH